MARNAVQFQKGLSEPAFERHYGTEEQCRAVVVASRWPNGFECPACGGREHSVVATRDLFQRTACRRQTSPTVGTIFAATKLPLRTWFRAICHLTRTKQGVSSVELGRRLGVRQGTAWTIKHKLKPVMVERDATKQLSGRVEIDDACLGGERTGGKRGRGAPGVCFGVQFWLSAVSGAAVVRIRLIAEPEPAAGHAWLAASCLRNLMATAFIGLIRHGASGR